MKSASLVTWTLPLVITVLALIDAVVHLTLDAVLFRGNFVGPLGPPPGAPAPPPGAPPAFPAPPISMPFQLNQMFVLNFLGYVVLVVLFWITLRRLSGSRWWIDVPLIVYAVLVFLAWVDFGRPNPMGYLGYLSKTVEVLLVIALLVHARLWTARDRLPLRNQREAVIRHA